MADEGYIKFQAHWEERSILIDEEILTQINQVRVMLLTEHWLGIDEAEIGFGNISVRIPNSKQFIITGSATGGIPILSVKDLSIVTSVDITQNSLNCIGETIASSESMSHSVVYAELPEVNAVIHIHSAEIWKENLHKQPTSDVNAAYGTPEMAYTLQKIICHTSSEIVIMGGHQNGIIAYGENLAQAYHNLLCLKR